MRHAASTEVSSHIRDQAALIVVGEPIFQIMQPREIFARAFAAAIAIKLDVMQQSFRRPTFLRLVQHPGEAERDFKKRPAIHTHEIRRWRLDVIVDLQREMLVTRAD